MTLNGKVGEEDGLILLTKDHEPDETENMLTMVYCMHEQEKK